MQSGCTYRHDSLITNHVYSDSVVFVLEQRTESTEQVSTTESPILCVCFGWKNNKILH